MWCCCCCVRVPYILVKRTHKWVRHWENKKKRTIINHVKFIFLLPRLQIFCKTPDMLHYSNICNCFVSVNSKHWPKNQTGEYTRPTCAEGWDQDRGRGQGLLEKPGKRFFYCLSVSFCPCLFIHYRFFHELDPMSQLTFVGVWNIVKYESRLHFSTVGSVIKKCDGF
jgi:hypothetical protein